MHRGDTHNSAIGLLIISSILWSSSFIAVKIGLTYLNPYLFAFLRMAVAAIVQLGILFSQKGLRAESLKSKGVWCLGLLNGIGFTLQFVGQQYTTPAKTALLADMNVIIVAILSWQLFSESFGSRKTMGVVLGIVGAVMITTNGNISTLTQGQFLGDALVILAGLAWAVFIVLHKRILTNHDWNAIELSASVMFLTAIMLAPAAILFSNLNLTVVPVVGWEWVAYTAIMTTVVPYALWIIALKAVSATIATVVGMLEIVAAMILSSLLIGETYGTITLLGAILILLSLLAVAEI